MKDDLIKINGKKYAFNLSKICDFISKVANRDMKETELLDSYTFEKGSKELSAKTIRELNTIGNGQDPIIYDLIKTLIVQILVYDSPEDTSLDLDFLPFGTKIAFNTLINEGFLIEIR